MVPDQFEFQLFEEDVDRFEPLMTNAVKRFPALQTTGIKKWFHGLESFTEDGMFILGEAPELRGYFVGTGFNAFGIASAGGAGKVLAEWILDGDPPFRSLAGRYRRLPATTPMTDRTGCARWRARHATTRWAGRFMRTRRPALAAEPGL